MKASIVRWLAMVIGVLGSGGVLAQSLVVPAQVGVADVAGQTFVVNFTPGPDTGAFNFVLNVAPSAALTITSAAANIPNGTTVCSNTAASVSCSSTANSTAVDLNPGTITVTYTAGAVFGPVALNFGATNFLNQSGGAETGVASNGVLAFANVAGPNLFFNPAPMSALTVGASGSGTTVTTTIIATPSGGAPGQSTTLACSIAGAGFAAPAVSGSPFDSGNPAPGTIGLACGASATAGTLACIETRSGSGGGVVVRTWPLTCAPAPGFNSVPAPGGTLNIAAIAGSTASAAVAINNPGTAPLNITGATVTGAGFMLGAVSNPIAPNSAGVVNVSCAVPTTSGTTITGTLSFTPNAAPGIANYTLSCTSLSASIPTLGGSGAALMAMLLLALGVVGLRVSKRSA